MEEDKHLKWRDGPTKSDMILEVNGESVAHIFPRDGHPGSFTVVAKNHGGHWGETPGQYFPTQVAAKGHARTHAGIYLQQEKRNLQEASRHHVINNLEQEWKKMGGDPKTMKAFRAEWERVVAVEYKLKVVEIDHGHER